MKTSLEIQRLTRATEQQNPGHNYLPSAGQPYAGNATAYPVMFACADGIGIWVEVEYLDENGDTQKRMLSKGIWPIITTQINGYRVMGELEGAVTAEVTTDNFQISVLM